jgi:hypothetical protein
VTPRINSKKAVGSPWERRLLDQLDAQLKGTAWRKIRSEPGGIDVDRGIHLGVFIPPYLDYILEGKKTIESRFSVNRVPPFNSVTKSDLILLKHSSGPVVGLCEVAEMWVYELDHKSLAALRKTFAERLCATDPSFWAARKNARYVTLMQVENVLRISPVAITKRDPRGWVVLRQVARKNLTLFQ